MRGPNSKIKLALYVVVCPECAGRTRARAGHRASTGAGEYEMRVPAAQRIRKEFIGVLVCSPDKIAATEPSTSLFQKPAIPVRSRHREQNAYARMDISDHDAMLRHTVGSFDPSRICYFGWRIDHARKIFCRKRIASRSGIVGRRCPGCGANESV